MDYDFSEEKKFSYKNLSMDEIIHHLAFFISRLWQIHVFGEGNTRTTAVFFRNLLLNENHPLHNRILHISGTFKEPEKVNIENKKVNIEEDFTAKTASHVRKLQEALGKEIVFGSNRVEWMGNRGYFDLFPQSEVLRRLKKALCFPAEDAAAFAEWKQENTEWINYVMGK